MSKRALNATDEKSSHEGQSNELDNLLPLPPSSLPPTTFPTFPFFPSKKKLTTKAIQIEDENWKDDPMPVLSDCESEVYEDEETAEIVADEHDESEGQDDEDVEKEEELQGKSEPNADVLVIPLIYKRSVEAKYVELIKNSPLSKGKLPIHNVHIHYQLICICFIVIKFQSGDHPRKPIVRAICEHGKFTT